MHPSHTGKQSAVSAPVKAFVWFSLAFAYLAASALGQRSVALVIVGVMVGVAIMASGRRSAGLLVGLLLAGAALYLPASVALLVYAPPLAAFAFMGWFFGRTLRAGSEPLIVQIAKVEHPQLPEELARHARWLTAAWMLSFVALFAVALTLIPFLTLDVWSRWVQGLGYVVPGALFLGEYLYRKTALGHYPHTSLPVLVRNIVVVMKAEAMAAQRRGQPGPR